MGVRPPYPQATMLRIHLMEQWYSLCDPAPPATAQAFLQG